MVRICLGLLFALKIFVAYPAYAMRDTPIETPQIREKTIEIISTAADRICGLAQMAGTTSDTTLQGSVRAEIAGLARKMVEADAVLNAGSVTTAYQNVMQKDLPVYLKNIQDCRLRVFETLVERMWFRFSDAPRVRPR